MDSKFMQISALGRPLYPGMLYDCRSDSFIPGVTLWDKEALHEGLDVHQHSETHLTFAGSDTLNDKSNLLDISASLKASFLSGLVEIGGSAKYLRDHKTSRRQCRVTMQYSQTTKFEQLTMKELGSIKYPKVFEEKTATHVVTAVLYGANAFMVFDYTRSENENKQAVEGNLHAVVKKIPTISIEGEASLKMTEEEKQLADCISVTFYGDFELEENPTSYKPAVEVYKKLPTLMKQQQNKGVPLTVWLYPLTLLDDKAAKLVRDINMSLLNKSEQLMEDLDEVERRCNDSIKNPTTHNFIDLKDRLEKFKALHGNYMRSFQKELSRLLPSIRGGTQEDKTLQDILNIHYTSPFTASNMNKWLGNIKTELHILNRYTSGLKDIRVVKSSGSLSSILLDPHIDVVVCLSFTSLKYKDSFLEALQDFENSSGFTVSGQTTERDFSHEATQPWFMSPDISKNMRQNLSLFTSFSKANRADNKIKFLITSIPDATNQGTVIQVYQKGLLTHPSFQPVSKPLPPVVVTSNEEAILKLSKSPTGETVWFRVEYRVKSTDSGVDTDEWIVKKTSDAQTSFTLTGLKPGQYLVRYRAVSDVGVSEASDSVSFTIESSSPSPSLEKLKITFDMLWNLYKSSFLNELRTKIMTTMGMSRWSPSTIKSEVTNVVDRPKIPHIAPIPGELRVGMALYFQGVVSAKGQKLSFSLKTGPGENDDIAYCFNPHMNQAVLQNSRRTGPGENDDIAYCLGPRMNQAVLQNSRKNGQWENEERISECPISSGSAFDIFILTKAECYEVYVNGQRCCLFKHRMPIKDVVTLYIEGGVIMNIVGIVENWDTSTFGKELKSGISRTKFSDIQSDVVNPVYKPSQVNTPYLGKLPSALRPGMALFFQGVVTSDCECFEIKLYTGPMVYHDIAFHFSSRIHSVVCNSYRNMSWENEEVIRGGPFVKGGAFDIFMVIKPECYEVMVNGLEFCTFNHRVPLDKVTSVGINGDIFMNKFGITVGDAIMDVTFPVI